MLITFGREGIVNSCHQPLEASLFVALQKAMDLTPPVSTIPVLVPKLRTHTKSIKITETLSFHQLHYTFISFISWFSSRKFPHQWPQAIETNELFSGESTPSGPPRRCFPRRFQDRTGMAWPWGFPLVTGRRSGDPDVKKPLVGGFGYSNGRNMK